MRRGAMSERQSELRAQIAEAIEVGGVTAELAKRIAFQFVFKFSEAELGNRAVWHATGVLLAHDVARLKRHVGLADRQISGVLPKLSVAQVEHFLDEVRAIDRRIARTIFNAALEAANPVAMGRRYLAEYQAVARELESIDPGVARTLANASFTAGARRRKALEHFKRFARLMKKFEGDTAFARMVAKAAFRAPNPVRAAEAFIADYQRVVGALTSNGIEPHIAKALASSTRFRERFGRTDALSRSN